MIRSTVLALIALAFTQTTFQQQTLQLQECDSTCFSSAADQITKSSGCANDDFPCLCHHGDFMVSVGRCLKDCFEDANGVDANGRAKFICLSLFLADANNYEGLVMPPNKTVQKRQDPPVAPAEVPTPTPLPTSSIPSLPVPELPSTVPSVPTTLPDIPTVTHPSVSSIPPLWSAASPKATAPISATTETVNTCAACATTTLSPSEEATLFLVQSTVLPTTMTAPESPTVVTITSAPQQSPKSYCETTTMTTSITTSMITTGTTTSVTRSGAAACETYDGTLVSAMAAAAAMAASFFS